MAKAQKPPKPPSTPERREMHTKLGLLTVAIMINLIGFSIVIPLLPEYITQGLHLPPSAAQTDPRIATYNGLLLSSYAFMQFLFAPLWGRLSDRIGRKPVIMVSLAGDVIFYALFGMSKHNIEWQFAARMLAGIFSSGTISVAQAYVADVTPPEDRAVGLGMLGAAFGVGFVLGPAIGGLVGQYNISLPMYIASGMALLNLVFINIKLPESRTAEQRANGSLIPIPTTPWGRLSMMGKSLTGEMGFLFILTFLVTFAFADMEGAFTPYIRHFFATASDVSGVRAMHEATRSSALCFTYVGVLLVIVQGGLVRKLRLKFTEAQMIVAGVALMAIGFSLFPFAPSVSLLLIGPMVPVAFGSGINNPALRALISRFSHKDNQGSTLGVSSSFDSLARATGPAFGGWIGGHYGLKSPFFVAGAIMAVALLWAISQYKKLYIPLAVSVANEPEIALTGDAVAPTE